MSKQSITSKVYSNPFVIQCMKCKYPNAAAEIYKRNAGSFDTYANHANVTGEILQEFLDGEEELTVLELYGIWQLSKFSIHCNIDYLVSERISYYDLSNPKHYKKVLTVYAEAEKAKKECISKSDIIMSKRILPLEEAKKNGFITRTQINYILRFIEDVERSKSIRENNPRGYKLKEAI